LIAVVRSIGLGCACNLSPRREQMEEKLAEKAKWELGDVQREFQTGGW
jgi:hypothetical protein